MNYDTYPGVFNTDLVEGMTPSGSMETPTIFRTNAIPNRLISFDKSIAARDTDQWVHFFIHDYQFRRIWHNPWKYLPILAKFNGVISSDFSIMWDYPRYMQFESTCHNREIGSWLQRNGVTVIPCVRWGKKDTYDFAFDGVEQGGTIAVGTAGTMREKEARRVFEAGFEFMLERIQPKRIVVYGSARSKVFESAANDGIEVIPFETATATIFRKQAV